MNREAAIRYNVSIRKGDQVKVLAGRDKGKTGRVLSVDAIKRKVTVEHANMIKRHTRPNPSKNIKGGIVEKEGPLDISNVMLLCPSCGKASRTGQKVQWETVRVTLRDGREVERRERHLTGRTCRRCEAAI